MTRRLLAFAALALLAACAATTIVEQWQCPAYTGGPFKRILVVGVTTQATTRRVFEDEFVRQLKARGTDAVASYTFIPEDGPASRERLAQAVKQSGADGVIATRIVKGERKTQVMPGAPVFPMSRDSYGYYGAGFAGVWTGYAVPPTVIQHEDVKVESQLFEARDASLVWSARSDVFAPTDPRKDSADFAATLIKALAERKLI